MTKQTSGKKLTSTQIILLAGISLIVVAVIVVGCILVLNSKQGSVPVAAVSAGAGNLVADEDNAGDVIGELKRKAAEGMFEIKMNSIWHFPDGMSPSKDAYVANSEANHLPFYFEVLFGENEEVIFKSPTMELGQALKEFALTKDLEAGTYDCICSFNTLKEDGTVKSTIRVAVTVVVEA